MILATDVGYAGDRGTAAVIGFEAWSDELASFSETAMCTVEAEYRPGSFFERELPCILPLVQRIAREHGAGIVVIDGYVDLGDKPGLGGYLFDALKISGLAVAVVGVAKNRFYGAPAVEVTRGESKHPLYVSSRGVDANTAAGWIDGMHGPYRMPTLLRVVDQLTRGLVQPTDAPR
ncbi:MAG: endonuclease V [Nannocystaceae bacterium]|nr:endonuclease V [Nannocystaceae bacterium]